jgi:hypothetical protein
MVLIFEPFIPILIGGQCDISKVSGGFYRQLPNVCQQLHGEFLRRDIKPRGYN